MSIEIGNINKEKEFLKEQLQNDFHDEWNRFFHLCLDRNGIRPLYLTHPKIAMQTLLVDLSDNLVEDFCIAYVYLTASYYSLDSFVDDQRNKNSDESIQSITDLPALVSASIKRFLKVFVKIAPDRINEFITLFTNLNEENSRALSHEMNYRRDPLLPYDFSTEYFYMWGRSNLFLFLFQSMSYFKEKPIDERMSLAIKKFLYFMQWGDDLGDWREDFLSKKWTPFLRNCFSFAGDLLSETELEQVVYLSGLYEKTLLYVSDGFKECIELLQSVGNSEPLINFINYNKNKSDKLYSTFIYEKSQNNFE